MKRSFIDAVNIIGFLVVLAVVIFAAYTIFVDKPFFEALSDPGEGEDSGTYSTDQSVKELIAKNISGRIEVEAWDNDWIQLDYVKRGPGRHPEVKFDLSGDRLSVKAIYAKGIGNFGSVAFYFKVPENLELLNAGSVSGRIAVEGLGTSTRQELSSTSGSITTDGSGELDISSVSGSLTFAASGSNILASTTSGRIDGILKKAPNPGIIDMSSVSGSIRLEVPSDLNADINMHSVSGSVSTEFPVSVTSTRKNSIKGTVGSGGTSIEISTVSGSIKITE